MKATAPASPSPGALRVIAAVVSTRVIQANHLLAAAGFSGDIRGFVRAIGEAEQLGAVVVDEDVSIAYRPGARASEILATPHTAARRTGQELTPELAEEGMVLA